MHKFVEYAMAFGVGVVGLVIVVILLNSLLTTTGDACTTSTYRYNISSGLCNNPTNISQTSNANFAGNITNQGLIFSSNFSNQWGLAGTILGYVLVLSILALIGIGAYIGYGKLKGSR